MADRDGAVHADWLVVLSDPIRLNLLRCLCELEEVSTAQLAPRAHTSQRTVRRHLDVLVELGLVEERQGQSDGETPGRPAASYVLSAATRRRALDLFDLLSQPLGPSRQPSSAPPRDR
jgi:predicted ArsR family transcriptional regulator